MSEGTAVQRLKTSNSALQTNQNLMGRTPFLDLLFIFSRGIETLSMPRNVLLFVPFEFRFKAKTTIQGSQRDLIGLKKRLVQPRIYLMTRSLLNTSKSHKTCTQHPYSYTMLIKANRQKRFLPFSLSSFHLYSLLGSPIVMNCTASIKKNVDKNWRVSVQ